MKVIIADEIHASLFPLLEEKGIEYDYHPKASREELKELLIPADGLIIRSKTQVNADLLDKAHSLKFVARAGAGLDTIDIPLLQSRNIHLINAPEGNCDALGEHVLALALAVVNNLVKSHLELKQFIWDREGNRGFELNGKTVGIIGYGHMGKATAKRFKAIGCRVLAFDKYVKGFGDATVEEVGLDQLHKESDLVSLHIPLTAETKEYYNDGFFDAFMKEIFFINAARGKVLDHTALLKALDSGKVKGAGLDVFVNEKMDQLTALEKEMFTCFLKHSNVVMTPHIGGWSFESYVKINEVLVKKITDISSD